MSRDRSWMLHKVSGSSLKLLVLQKNAHARIIWSGCFIPTTNIFDSILFATISRDKSIKVWQISVSESDLITSTINASDKNSTNSVNYTCTTTLISTYRCMGDGGKSNPMSITPLINNTVSVGFEDGSISIFNIDIEKKKITRNPICLPGNGHSGPVTSLVSWKDSLSKFIYIASGSEDNSVRIHSLENFLN